MEKRTYTKQSFRCLIIPHFFLAAFLAFSALAAMTEFPTNRSGIYLVFSMIATLLMLFLPMLFSVCGILGLVYQNKALRNQESKPKNIVMLAASVMYILVAAILTCLLWQGAMSV